MTEAFRRDDRMISLCHPSVHRCLPFWLDEGDYGLAAGCPSPPFFAYRDALEPLMISLRTDKTVFSLARTLPLRAGSATTPSRKANSYSATSFCAVAVCSGARKKWYT